MLKIWLLILITILSVAKSFAARPLTTDDVGTVAATNFELETGYDVCNIPDCPEQHLYGISLKHGVTERMDIGISLPYQLKPEQTEKIGAAVVGMKLAVLKNIFTVTLNNELGSGRYIMNNIFTKDIGPVRTHLNLMYTATGNLEEKGNFGFACAGEYCLEKFDFVGETLGNEAGFQDLLLGVRYKLDEATVFDVAYNRMMNTNSNRLTLGFHYGF